VLAPPGEVTGLLLDVFRSAAAGPDRADRRSRTGPDRRGLRRRRGARHPYHHDRHAFDRLDGVDRLAADGVLSVSIARTFPLDGIQEAAALSRSGRPGGKLILVPAGR
jgi:NADPH:quinone reductase-like Zn-dependent oxidoreductase